MKIIVRSIFLAILLLSFNPANGQKLNNGIYIACNGGLIREYAILTVSDDSASMEIFTFWQGVWLPVIGAWNNTYKPQLLKAGSDNALRNEIILVKRKQKKLTTKIIGIARNTFTGRIKFKFKQVGRLPEEYQTIQEKGVAFARNKSKL